MRGLARFLDPPRLRTVESTGVERRATWLELFVDLVFVVAIAELGSYLSGDPTLDGFLGYTALFVPVWWAWAGLTYYANRFDTDDLLYRVFVLAAMFSAAAMATNVHSAFAGGANAFALAYIAVRVILVLLYVRARSVPEGRALATWYAVAFSAGIGAWTASLLVGPPGKWWLWALALAFELSAPIVGWRLIPRAPIDVRHVPERFGLLTIIVLGESVLAVVLGVRETAWQLSSATVAVAGFVAAAAVWWIYFEFLDSAMVRRNILSGLTFTYAHFPLVLGIAAMGAGVKVAIKSVENGKYDGTGWILCAGVALCMLALAAIHLATPPAMFDADVWLRLAGAAFALALLPFAADELSPLIVSLLLAASLVAQLVVELRAHEHHAPAPARDVA